MVTYGGENPGCTRKTSCSRSGAERRRGGGEARGMFRTRRDALSRRVTPYSYSSSVPASRRRQAASNSKPRPTAWGSRRTHPDNTPNGEQRQSCTA